jgi:hypothetical protein
MDSAKNTMINLIEKFGRTEAVAIRLDITNRYVEMIRDGKHEPGKHLLRCMVSLRRKLSKKDKAHEQFIKKD